MNAAATRHRLVPAHANLPSEWSIAASNAPAAALPLPAAPWQPILASGPAARSHVQTQPPPPVTPVSWTNANGGDWAVAANWSTNSVPGSSNAVTIAVAGSYGVTVSVPETAYSVTLSAAGATLNLTSALSIGTSFSLAAGTLALSNGGTLAGGTLALSTNATFDDFGGTLSGVAFQGTLTLSTNNDALTLANGVTFAGAGGSGAATINLVGGTYQSSFLYALGNTTLANATLNIGADGGYGADYLENLDSGSGNATLTLASSFVINQLGYAAGIISSDATGDAIINNGVINANYNGGVFIIDATHFTNAGTINVSGGDTIELTGAISASLIDGIKATTNGFIGIDGTVTGGTITSPSGAVGSYGSSGTLSGVAFQGTLTLSTNNDALTLANGVTFAGAGGSGAATINLVGGTYQSSFLYALGNTTLANATLNIGADGGYGADYLENLDSGSGNATLTLASSFVINQLGYAAGIISSDATGDAIINNGVINANYNGGVFIIDATHFTNAGTINVSGGDTIELTGAISASLIDGIKATTNGFIGIDGTVTGGTITSPSGAVGSYGSSGTLSGVAFQGTLTLSTNNDALTLANGVTFAGAGGSGAATINLVGGTYQSSFLYALGNTTLANATLNIGADGGYGADYLENLDSGSGNATLTLASSFVINQLGYAAGIISSDATGDAIINNGVINANYNGGVFIIDATHFTNAGTINVSGGDTIELTGAISASLIDGIKATTNGFIGIDGTVTGGTITSPSGAVGSYGSSGTLSGVAFQGTLTLSTNNDALTLANGVTFAGAGGSGAATINLVGGTYQSSFLYALGNTTLANATLNIGADGGYGADYLENLDSGSGNATLTLASSFVINQLGYAAGIISSDATGDAIINNGVINANYNGGVFIIDATHFTNAGTINVSGGDTIELTGAISASLIDGIKATTNGFIGIDGTVTGGTITSPSGAVGSYGSSGTLSGVAFQGTLTLSTNNDALTLANGVTFAGAGGSGAATINLVGGTYQSSFLYALGNTTLANATLNIGADGGYGADYLENLDSGSGNATLTLASSFVINQLGYVAGITSSSGPNDAVINNGTLFAAYAGGTFLINPVTFTNNGTLQVSNSDTLILSTNFTNLSATTLARGTYIVGPNGTFELGNNQQVVTLAANLTLSGTNSILQSQNGITFDSTFATLATAGTLSLLAGRNFTAAGAILDQGSLILGNTTFTASAGLMLASTGTLGGYGTVAAAVLDNGLIAASGGTLILAGGLTGNGSLSAASGAVLDLTNGGTLNQLATGAGTLQLDSASYTLTGLRETIATVNIDNGATLSGTGYLAGAVSNLGMLAATGGTLTVQGAISGAGLLTAAAGATLDIAGGGSAVGTISGAGTLRIDGTSPFVLNGAALTIASVIVDAGATLDLTRGGALPSTVTGAGTLQLDGATPYTLSGTETIGTVAIDAGVKLSGSGTLAGAVRNAGILATTAGTLVVTGAATGAGAWQIASGTVLDLAGGGTLAGAFTGAGTLRLDNATPFTLAGITLSTAALAVDAGATLSGTGTIASTTTDAGAIVAAGGTLVLGTVSGTGTLAANAGATLDLTSATTLTEQISGAGTLRLDNGSYTLATGAGIATILLDAGATLTGAGTLAGALIDNGTLAATTGTLSVGGAFTGTGSVTVGSGATLDLRGGGTLAGAVAGAGTLQLDNATTVLGVAEDLLVTTLLVDAGAALSGAGTIASALTDNGNVTASGGTLILAGAVSGSGTLSAAAGAVLDIKSALALTETIIGAGTLELEAATTLAGGTIAAGTLTLLGGASLLGTGSVTSAVSDAGTIAASGGTLTLAGALSGAGTAQALSGATLVLSGGGSFSGTIGGAGTIDIAAALTLNAGASLSAATILDTANITLGASTSLTASAATSLTLAAAAGQTLIIAGPGSASFTNAGTMLANSPGTAEFNLAVTNTNLITGNGGTLAFLGALTNSGTMDAASGLLSVSTTVGGKGTLQIGSAGTLSLLLGAGNGQTVDFLSSTGGLLDLTMAKDFKGTIAGFGGSDTIDLIKTKETSFTFANNVLTIKDNKKTVAALHFTPGYTQSDFTVGTDGQHGTAITLSGG